MTGGPVPPNRFERACDGPGWTTSPALRCLGFEWCVRSNDAGLVERVTAAFSACLAADGARHRFLLRRRETASGRATVSVYRDGRAVLRRCDADLAVAHLAWEVNRGVVDETPDLLLIHGAAAAAGPVGLVLPGPQGTGKSTLVAALVLAGLHYVTDEIVAVDPESLTLHAYPRPISLDVTARDLLPDLRRPGCDGSLVPPRTIRSDAVARPGVTPRLVVFPRYRPGASTALHPVSRADAAVELARNSFNFESRPGALETVAELVRGCRCFRMDVNDLPGASRALLALLEGGEPR